MKIRIVVADDFPLFRDGLTSALGADPALEVVGEAGDGVEAAELAGRLKADVVVLDMMMPRCGGAEAIELVKRAAPRARVLAISASGRVDLVREALDAGASGYVTKSAGARQLRQAVVEVYGGGISISESLIGRAVAEDAAPLLSDRENEVLRLIARGSSDAEVAAALDIRVRTVQSHLARVREKTGVRRRSELVIWAMQHGVL
jgi:DNA-binding NarL/FixJ family response regulator